MNPNPISLAIAVVLAGFGVLAIAPGHLIVPGGVLIALAVVVLASLKMAQQWEQAVVLRAGKFLAVKGPGLFGIVPIVDHIAAMIDTRGLGKERPQRPYSIFGRELDISRVQIGSPIPDASLISISSPIIRSWMKVPITVILANGDFTSSQPLASRLARPSAW